MRPRNPLLRTIARTLALTLVTGALWLPATAEVSTKYREGKAFETLIGAIIEDSDPVPGYRWKLMATQTTAAVLNPFGEARQDGRPDVVFDKPAARPHVVWAYNAGSDHDVAYASALNDGTWSATTFLTASTAEELDPRVFLEAGGALHVVWWVPGSPDRIYTITRSPGATQWGVPVLVTPGAHGGRRPSVGVHDGILRIVYERPVSGTGTLSETDVMVASRETGGAFAHTRLATAPSVGALDPVLHVEEGVVWADWLHDAGQLAASELSNGGWGALTLVPATDDSWLGVEDARRRIRGVMLAP